MNEQEMVHYPPPPCQVSPWQYSVQGQVYPSRNCKNMIIM